MATIVIYWYTILFIFIFSINQLTIKQTNTMKSEFFGNRTRKESQHVGTKSVYNKKQSKGRHYTTQKVPVYNAPAGTRPKTKSMDDAERAEVNRMNKKYSNDGTVRKLLGYRNVLHVQSLQK